MLRLSAAGARQLDDWLSGRPTGDRATSQQLRHRLVEAGLIHPIVDGSASHSVLSVGFVIPVFDDPTGLTVAIESIRSEMPDAPVVVVDDASPQTIAPAPGVTVVRHDDNRGPAAARNTGASALGDVDVDVIVFVDSDVRLGAGSLATLLAHFDDSTLQAIAPRVRAEPGSSRLARYEADASPLDMGPNSAVVRPGSPVPFVPSTVLAIRQDAFVSAAGFDESLRVGEDVDFVWRLVEAGGLVRYEPRAEAWHRNRASWAALLRQRHTYGTAAAELEERHPGDVAAVEIPAPMLVAWAAAWLGGPLGLAAGGAVAANEVRRLHTRLGDGLDNPARDVAALTVLGHRYAAQWIAHAVRRVWAPVALLVAPFSKRARRVLFASVLASVVFDRRRQVDVGVLDDLAYCSGVWRGAHARRSAGVLVPRTAGRKARTANRAASE